MLKKYVQLHCKLQQAFPAFNDASTNHDAAALLGPWAGLPLPDHKSLDALSSLSENKHSQPSEQQARDGQAQTQRLGRSIKSLVPLLTVRKIPCLGPLGAFRQLSMAIITAIMLDMEADNLAAVKFEGDTLPPILNALETENGGNKLILEVAVRQTSVQISRKNTTY